jgi:putative Holliday junction resolvase
VGQVLGIDVGMRTLGLAVSDDAQRVAMPLTVIRRAGLTRDLTALRTIVEERGITEAVVGLPLNLDGSPGAMSAEADRIVAALERMGLTVHREDERLTTVDAERMLIEADLSRRRRRQVVDKIAATYILQDWLDRAGARGGGGGA